MTCSIYQSCSTLSGNVTIANLLFFAVFVKKYADFLSIWQYKSVYRLQNTRKKAIFANIIII